MKKIVIASNNTHKVAEIMTALNFDTWQFITLADAGVASEPVENADSFEGNARIKARAAHELTGLAALADDSGIVVDALEGRPGINSARYAGAHASDAANNQKLLEELEGVEQSLRTARFVCALVFIEEDGSEIVAQGTIEGIVGYSEQGSDGFGYDPLFFPLEFGGTRTLAEVTQEEKNQISHRGNALRALRHKISAQL